MQNSLPKSGILPPLVSLFATVVAVGLLSPMIADAASRKAAKKSTAVARPTVASEAASKIATITPIQAADSPLGDEVKGLVDAAVKSGLRSSELGLWVASVGSGPAHLVFEHNSEKSFIPASLSKIPTGAAALSLLPSAHKFKTVFAMDRAALQTNQTVAGGVLKGPLYFVGGGDPSFVSENLWFLVNELVRTGVKTIEGDLIVDDSLFDSIRYDGDRQEQRVDRAYDAPIGALSFNWNSITTWVRPGIASGEPANVTLDVSSPFFELKNRVKTNGKSNGVSVERLRTDDATKGEVVVASGAIGSGQSEKAYYKSIREPALVAGHAAIVFLKQRGIEVKGTVRSGKAPDGVAIVATVESKPIQAVVADMLKWSNNYVAEMLVKNLAASAEAPERPATMATGLKRVREWIEQRAGLKAGEYEYVNAAGLTRVNRFSPKQLGQMLLTVQHDFRVFPEFLAALPIGGTDGTLRSRMKNGTVGGGSIRAKTGLLDGVVGLAGFSGNVNGAIHSFVFIFNGPPSREVAARALFDRIADRLAN